MQVSTANDVRIYNLSSGKALPHWISKGARKKLEKGNTDVQRRIELIQDFQMPDVSNTVNISPDGRYVFASGSYKPWLKCYDLNDLSLKFERGIDSDIIKVLILSDDYSKVVILQEERYIEMHAAFGRYFRMRMPRFGRDMAFGSECSDLFLVGTSDSIYRLNLEQGTWLSPLVTNSSAVNCCQFADEHQLFVCGTNDGMVEAWDHRDKCRVATLNCVTSMTDSSSCEITSLKFRDALHLGVGTSTGHILQYDIRSMKPLIVKDHYNSLPITKIDYVRRDDDDLVLSMDSRVLKMWHESSGKPFAAVEADTALTDFTRYPDSGLLFFANEAPRMLQYFIPALGTAPKWCSFLETITEELEETEQPTVYDDYRFVTKDQLESLGLSRLIGTNVLRAYMHGYFMDARLYNKAHTLTQPFAYEKYRERKVRDMVDKERENTTISKSSEKLPKVNKDLVLKLRENVATKDGRRKKQRKAELASALLEDDRFKKLFENQDFEVDQDNEQYKLNVKNIERTTKNFIPEDEQDESDSEPVASMHNQLASSELNEIEGDVDMKSDMESSSEDEEDRVNSKRRRENVRKLKRENHKRLQKIKLEKKRADDVIEKQQRLATKPKKFVLHELNTGETVQKFMDEAVVSTSQETASTTILQKSRSNKKEAKLHEVEDTPFGGRSIVFKLEKSGREGRQERDKKRQSAHKEEREKLVRKPTSEIKRTIKKLPSNILQGNERN